MSTPRGDSGEESGRPPTPADPRLAAHALLEELAAAAVLADVGDDSSMARVRSLLGTLQPLLDDRRYAGARPGLDRGLELLGGDSMAANFDEALAAITASLDLLNRSDALADAPADAPAASLVTAAPCGPTALPMERDEDTISLFGDFLAESTDLLASADRLLMRMEREGADAEMVNGLFRVFHTVKGIAGFLDIQHVTDVGHTTETMLDRCRGPGGARLEGGRLDLVFDATGMLRRMLDEIRGAIEQKVVVATSEDVPTLLARIRAATNEIPLSAAAIREEKAAREALDELAIFDEVEQSAPPPVAVFAVAAPPRDPCLDEPDEPPPAATPPTVMTTPMEPMVTAPGSQPNRGEVKLRETLKVDLERVDSLVEMIGELVVVEAQVVGSPEINLLGSVRVRNCLAQLAKVTRDLQDVGMRMRMVPVAGAFQKMERMVRDLARKAGKQVRVITSGETTEMDRTIVEQIADPLVHMMRNAVDHGIESTEDRIEAGKASEGQIRLSAYHEGGSSVIEVKDDGRGLDKAAILKKAIDRDLVSAGAVLADEDIFKLIFAPGLSTARKVTEVSGRGVGMDVVKRNIDALRGRVMMKSVLGEGTTFKIILPLTLAIIDGMLVSCGSERYIIPTLSIIESIQPDRSMLTSFAGSNEMINLRGQILPLLRLDRLFELSGARSDPTEGLVVFVEGMGRKVGLLVDDVVTQQQVVIKTLGAGLGDVRFVSGAAILADGRVGLILNIEEIAGLIDSRSHRSRGEWSRAGTALPVEEPAGEEAGT